MPPKTVKKVLADTLEDLSEDNYKKFCHALVDRKEEPRVRRSKVEKKNFLDITDVLVSTFTEAKAVRVAEDLLRQIDCNEEADSLVAEAGGSSQPGDDEHFVDKHRVELTKRVGNIAPILDELLARKVIQQEAYDKMRALPTSQEKMRELYSSSLKAGRACKDVFYKILEEYESYLMNDLKGL